MVRYVHDNDNDGDDAQIAVLQTYLPQPGAQTVESFGACNRGADGLLAFTTRRAFGFGLMDVTDGRISHQYLLTLNGVDPETDVNLDSSSLPILLDYQFYGNFQKADGTVYIFKADLTQNSYTPSFEWIFEAS